MFKILLLLLIGLNASAKELDARSWAQYKMDIELLEIENQKIKIIQKYKAIFEFFDERENDIRQWNQKHIK
jgi:hypothetical protein